MAAQTHEETIRRWVDSAWNRGDFSETASIYLPSYFMHDPNGDVSGPAGLAEFVSAYRSAFPNMTMTVEHVIGEGDLVAWRFTVTGRQEGELNGIPPTGREIRVGGIVITRFEGERWAEDWVQYDLFGMLRQLGVIGEPVHA